jgi:hypothetical protein
MTRTIALMILVVTLASALLVGTTFALNKGALPGVSHSLCHGDSARLIPAQAPQSGPSPTDSVPNHILEQYKAYLTDLGAVGSQFATTQAFYLTIISALIAVLAFKETIRPIQHYFGAVPIVIFIFIALVCATWWLTAQVFSNLIGAKFEVLRAIEQKYPALYPMFTEQTQHYECHWTYGIIRHQSVLIVVIGLGALAIAAAGIRWQLSNRNTRDVIQMGPEET